MQERQHLVDHRRQVERHRIGKHQLFFCSDRERAHVLERGSAARDRQKGCLLPARLRRDQQNAVPGVRRLFTSHRTCDPSSVRCAVQALPRSGGLSAPVGVKRETPWRSTRFRASSDRRTVSCAGGCHRVTERLVDRPGLSTPGEDAAWEALRERVTIVLRPIGAPMSIGFFGLAAATFVVAGLQLGWVEQAEGKKVALVLVTFAFLAQSVAGLFSFLGRDGVAATAMLTLALTWLVVGSVLWTSKPGATSDVLGLFLFFAGAAMALLAATAALSKLVPALVFAVASLRFVLTGVYELSSHHGWEDAAGVAGLVLFALAMYAAWAAALEDALGQTVLPFGRRGKGKIAIRGSLLEQVKDSPTEPGVRTQL